MHIVWTFKIKARALTINAFYTAGLNTICNNTGRVCVCVLFYPCKVTVLKTQLCTLLSFYFIEPYPEVLLVEFSP